MASINDVTILGNLGSNPELRFTQSGTAVCTLSVATSRKYKNRDGDEVETVQWHRVIVWGPSAEWVTDNKRRGDQVLVRGHLQTRSYEHTDKDGNVSVRYATEIVARLWDPFGGIYGLYGEKPRGNRPPPPTDDDAPGKPTSRDKGEGRRLSFGAKKTGVPGTVGGPKTLGPPPDDGAPAPGDADFDGHFAQGGDDDIPF
jgi:single-strand DNA-binding protein